MTWYNADGLLVKFGTEEATVGKAGEYEWDGPQKFVELVISDMTKVTSSAVIQDYNVILPKGAVIQDVTVISNVACTSGGSATLDVGLSRTDTTTELDYNGIVAALALTAIDTDGETNKITKGGTGAGALFGAALANNGYLTVNYNTAAFTAGKVTVRIYFTLNAP